MFGRTDVRFECFSGKGPGGQYRNRHAICVRAIHLPTGTVAVATSERSLSQNMKAALASLDAKLARAKEDAAAARRRDAYDRKPDASFGNAIRTYRMCGSDQGIVDHRTGMVWPIDFLKRGRIDPMLQSARRRPHHVRVQS